MKKIILTLGLSIAFTASPVLAENLIDQSSSTFEETRKTYIKPFVGYGIYPSGTFFAKEINFSLLTELPSTIAVFTRGASQVPNLPDSSNLSVDVKCNVDYVLCSGIDIGRDINDYFGIVGEIGNHYFQGSFHFNNTEKMNGESLQESADASLSIISCMLKPVISVIRSESFSFYVTGGIGGSYGRLRDMTENISLKPEFLGMSWMLGTGVTIDISDYTKLDIGYSYKTLGHLPTSKLSNGHIEDINIYCHSVHLGVRFYL